MRIFFLCLLFVFGSGGAIAQQKPPLASLVADNISVDPNGRVTASGNVVVYFDGTTLMASSVSYDRSGDQLTIEGPIRIADGEGTILVADQAELSRDLRTGVLISARMVLDQQLQMAAQEIRRVDDRYTELDRVVASSCEVCEKNPVPIWEIRADRIIHDQDEQQLYFTNAQMRVVGVPIFYTPRLRLPDPTLDRATGFLIPRFRTSSILGTGIKIPYFITLGDHADVTLTPYLSTRTSTVELSFRQELRLGEFNAEGAWTNDDIEGDRGYLFASGKYYLPRDFVLGAQLELASDPGYLFQYNYSDKDRLTNQISVTRVREKDVFRAAVSEFRTFREDEIPVRDTLPDQFIEVSYIRDLPALSFGGNTELSVDAIAINRPSSADIDGRDVNRIGAALDWGRQTVFGPGLVASAEVGLRVDAFNIGQDSNFDTNLTRVVPRAAAELRWPLQRTSAGGVQDILQPIIRFDISERGGDDVPLEDSRVVEFDEANLFSPTRYPGQDGVEDGARLAAGVTWRRNNLQDWQFDLAVGRIAHLDGELGFGEGSGLEGDQSEWLLATSLNWGNDLMFSNRSLFSEEFDFTLSETRLNWSQENFGLGSTYIFAQPEPAEDREEPLSELTLDAHYDLNDQWTANSDFRYDFEQGRAARVGVGLDYSNECLDLSLSLTRRYASSTSVDPTTEFGFRVSLAGVGGGNADKRARRACRG